MEGRSLDIVSSIAAMRQRTGLTMELFPIFSSLRLCKAPMAAGIDFRLLPRSDRTVILETSNNAEGKLFHDLS